MLKGFKKFISQGNVIDLTVAVIIGNAFKPIVDKVTETIMGIIGQVIGSPNFDSVGKFSLLSNPQGDADYIYPGAILTQVINFLLIAAAVYFQCRSVRGWGGVSRGGWAACRFGGGRRPCRSGSVRQD